MVQPEGDLKKNLWSEERLETSAFFAAGHNMHRHKHYYHCLFDWPKGSDHTQMVQPEGCTCWGWSARNRRGTRLSWSYPCVWPSWHEKGVTAARTRVAISESPGIGLAAGPGDLGWGGGWQIFAKLTSSWRRPSLQMITPDQKSFTRKSNIF